MIKKFGYALATNQGKGRSRPYKAATGTSHLRHRTIVLTSAEQPLSVMARDAGRERQGGETVRFTDLPAIATGGADIFDKLKVRDRVTRKKITKKLIKTIIADCQSNHGQAFHTYIEKLIPMRALLPERVEGLMNEFVDEVSCSHNGPEADDIANKFGLLYAAGILGLELEIVPWTPEDVLAAVKACYRRARRMLVDDGELLRKGLSCLRKAIRALPAIPVDERKPIKFESVKGYRSKKADNDVAMIKVDAFNRILRSVPQRELVVKWLLENNYLELRQERGQSGATVRRPKEQFLWPDGERRRSIRINGMPRLKSG